MVHATCVCEFGEESGLRLFLRLNPSISMVLQGKVWHVETHLRSILKAVTWRAGGTFITCLVAWLLTGSLDLAARIGAFDTLLKVGAFYVHERAWNHLRIGKAESPEYEI